VSISPYCLKLDLHVVALARRSVQSLLAGQGTARHRADESHAIGICDLGALADWLDNNPHPMGATPTGIAAAYGLVASVLEAPLASPVKDHGRGRPNLVAWRAWFRSRYYPCGVLRPTARCLAVDASVVAQPSRLPRSWRSSPVQRIAAGLALLLFLVIGATLFPTQTAWGWRGGAVAMALFGLAGVVDALTIRI
jgi:hypothetical protein